MQFKTLDDIDVADRRVLVRVDLNVPMDGEKVSDMTRIERAAPTLSELAAKGARVVILSHFGRPAGKPSPKLSLAPLVGPLAKVLGRPVAFASDCVGPQASQAVGKLNAGDILLLENLRFHKQEEANDPGFVDQLAALGDIYVNDAFSCAHRAHASTEGLAHRLPAIAGRLMQAELEALEKALGNPAHPVAAIVGGAKISTKLELLGNLIDKVDCLIIGGGMANTFLHAQGIDVGISLCEKDLAETARKILADAKGRCRIVLPLDAVVATAFKADSAHRTVPIGKVGAQEMILDIGPRSVAEIVTILEASKTVVWNGPVGAFEMAPFAGGTMETAQAIARLTAAGRLLSVAGGGDTVAALGQAGVVNQISYVSTAGGAFLEWMEGKTLPGVAALARAA